ncbi:MAG: hypothetical protein JSV86_09770 [Gemmatimonadota bacterium]|nr:MAG: hypothetical protein JSV86_09770 [Gemmatimonadota bacterium]
MGIRRVARWAIGLAAILLTANAGAAQEVRTIAPGMTTDQVKAEFGEPRGVAARGPFTYYYYDNGCEYECGFPDLVIFENDEVVDAVLRAPWNEYAGESSSPKGTVARATPGGMRLEVPTTIESVEVRPAEAPPAETLPAEMPATVPAEAAQPPDAPDEFALFVPVCAQAMVQSGVSEGDSQALCECTAEESEALGVEPSTIAEITQQVQLDPTHQTEDERVRQASSICFDRIFGETGG